MSIPEKILQNHGLSRTQCRIDVLSTLLEAGVAVSEASIRSRLSSCYDRATIFRTLRTFVERGVLHSIPVDGQDLRYALSGDFHAQTDTHVHFHCTQCSNVYCIKDVNLSKPNMPKGFKVSECEVMLNGVCAQCDG